MSKKINVNSAMGATREDMAVKVAFAGEAWRGYGEMHAETFAKNNLQKYAVQNSKGEIVARNAVVSALQEQFGSELATNASTLRHEDYLTIMQAVTELRELELVGISDLESAGLTVQVQIGDQLVGVENVSDIDDALQEQNPNGTDDSDFVYTLTYSPNPITHKSFSVPFRNGQFNYKTDFGMKRTIRKVLERLEETLFNGNTDITVEMGGITFPIYGYTTHPKRGIGTISDWRLVAKTGDIYNEINSKVNGTMYSTQGGVKSNSVILYCGRDFKEVFSRDYVPGQPSESVRDHCLKGIDALKDIKFTDKLAAGEVVFVEMSDGTVVLAKASDLVTVPHTKTSPFESTKMTTYAAMVGIIKADSTGKTGILHCTVA